MVCRGRVERKILPEEVLMFNSGVGNISKIGGGGGLDNYRPTLFWRYICLYLQINKKSTKIV